MGARDSEYLGRVFISYASEDREDAGRLYDDLRSRGFEPWWDVEDLVPGQNWENVIRRVIRERARVVLLVSENTVSRGGFIQKEIGLALDVLDEVPEGEIFLIQARLDRLSPRQDPLNFGGLDEKTTTGCLFINPAGCRRSAAGR